MADGWAKVEKASEYAGISERTMREWLKDGLKHSRLPSGHILVRYSDIDTYLESFTENEKSKIDDVVSDVLRGLA